MVQRDETFEFDAPRYADIAEEMANGPPEDHDDPWFHEVHELHEDPEGKNNADGKPLVDLDVSHDEVMEDGDEELTGTVNFSRNDTSMAMDAEGEHEVEMGTENSSSPWFGGESTKRERQEGGGMEDGGTCGFDAESPGVSNAMVDDSPCTASGSGPKRRKLGGGAQRITPGSTRSGASPTSSSSPANGGGEAACPSPGGGDNSCDPAIQGLLIELGLEACVGAFGREGIDAEALLCLGDGDLASLGVTRLGDRSKLRSRAKALNAPPQAPPPPKAHAPAPQPAQDAPRNHAASKRGARPLLQPSSKALAGATKIKRAATPSDAKTTTTTKRPFAPSAAAAPPRKASAATAPPRAAPSKNAKEAAAGEENKAPGGNQAAESRGGGGKGGGKSIEELLAMHNKQFKPKVTYEPAKHGVKDIRKWEQEHGRKWYDLKPEERQEANDWIAAKKWAEAST